RLGIASRVPCSCWSVSKARKRTFARVVVHFRPSSYCLPRLCILQHHPISGPGCTSTDTRRCNSYTRGKLWKHAGKTRAWMETSSWGGLDLIFTLSLALAADRFRAVRQPVFTELVRQMDTFNNGDCFGYSDMGVRRGSISSKSDFVAA